MASTRYDTLTSWCHEHGVVIDGIVGADVDIGGRGVVALQDLAPGHIVLEVPEPLLLTVASAKRDHILAPLLKEHSHLSSNQTLAIHLLHEASKGPSSFWHTYIQCLPIAYTTFCIFNETDIAALQLPEATAAASSAVAEAKSQWESARPALRALDMAVKWRTLAAWLWATATIASRTMYVPWDTVGALTPFGDLHNYEPPPPPCTPDLLLADNTAPEDADTATASSSSGDGHFDEASASYKIVARRPYKAGEQVFLCYGAHTNLDLLELYGFLLPSNPHDRAFLPPELFAQHCSFKPIPAAACYLHADGHPSWDLLRLLRLNAASAADRKAKGNLLAAGQRASVRDDLKCLIWLAEACERHLQQLPTTVEEDEALVAELQQRVAAGQAREQALLAVQWRAGHKRVVRRALQVAQQWFGQLRRSL